MAIDKQVCLGGQNILHYSPDMLRNPVRDLQELTKLVDLTCSMMQDSLEEYLSLKVRR